MEPYRVERVALWNAINRLVVECGGEASAVILGEVFHADTIREIERALLVASMDAWPKAWLVDLAEQNKLLPADEKLSPAEYLQCRADDCAEHAWYVARERELQELLLAIIDTAGTLTLADRFVKAAERIREWKGK